jgi:formylglycine-generating enzyme required for sulfatase activity
VARVAGILACWLVPLCAMAQQSAIDSHLKEAGSCGRCHVASVLEWAMSGHAPAGTTCTGCHGESKGHVKDERNNIKPEHIPHDAAIARLCDGCHDKGCTKTGHQAGCQTCHHVHALIDPKKPLARNNERLAQLDARGREFDRRMGEGERLLRLGEWDKARVQFRAALEQSPGDRRAAGRVRLCERRLKPGLPGFEAVGPAIDPDAGLPREVTVSGQGIAMLLIAGGDVDLGSDRLAASRPVHTVRIEPFYLGKYELTQGQWKALMGANPSRFQGPRFPDAERLPVERISWQDCQAFLRKLNETVPGSGFRLPTEAEWEYAARAGAAAEADELSAVAVYDTPGGVFATRPAGSRKPNRWGLFDMRGNIWEWCSSLSRPYPYDANDGRESLADAGLRILRGGGFADTPDLLDPAFRHAARPRDRMPWNGMRLARSIPQAGPGSGK